MTFLYNKHTMIREVITAQINEALDELGIRYDPKDIELEHPAELAHGDYASNIAMKLASKADTNPRELAGQIAEALRNVQGDFSNQVQKIEIAGPGFINFTLARDFFSGQVANILDDPEGYGKPELEPKKFVVEYSSPNIAKPFSIGHFRSTVIGDAIANILEYCGHEVVRDNHLGDWGTQFGKLIVGLREFGPEMSVEIGGSDVSLNELVAVYVRFHEEAKENDELNDRARAAFKKLEEGSEAERKIWQWCIDISMKSFARVYNRLGVEFDTQRGESEYFELIDDVLADLEEAGLLYESEGAKVVYFGDPQTDPDEHELPPLLVEKQDGSTLYATRDLATDKWRKQEYGDDITIVNEVGAEQKLYFKQIFETEKMLGYFDKGQRVHVPHGLYRFQDGKMSTREGNVIWLSDVIDQAIDRAKDLNADDNLAEMVGIGALKYNDLKRDAKSEIVFDWDELLTLEGNSGPYLQYTYARCRSLLTKGEEAGLTPGTSQAPDEVMELGRRLYRFPEVIERAGRDYSPHYVAGFVYQIAQDFNALYGRHTIIDTQNSGQSEYYLALAEATSLVIKKSLDLLGIEAPKQM